MGYQHLEWNPRTKKYKYDCDEKDDEGKVVRKGKRYSKLPIPRFVQLHDVTRVSAWFRLREFIIESRHRAQLTMEFNFFYIMVVFFNASFFITIIIILALTVLGETFFRTTFVTYRDVHRNHRPRVG